MKKIKIINLWKIRYRSNWFQTFYCDTENDEPKV